MKKFKFSLQVLLDVRIREEKSTKGELYLAQSELAQAEHQLQSLETKKESAEVELKTAVNTGITVKQLQVYYSYLDKLKDSIEKQRTVIDIMKVKCDNIRIKLIEISKAIKMLETLKEQKYKAYVKELELDDIKAMDDFINSRAIIE